MIIFRNLENSEERGDQLLDGVLILKNDVSLEQQENDKLLSEIKQLNVRMKDLEKAELENNKLNRYLRCEKF